MKDLVTYIQESKKSAFDGADFFGKWYFDNLNYKYYNKETGLPTLEEIEEAYGTTANVTGDPSWVSVNGIEFTKIKKNEWHSSSVLSHALGGSCNNENIYKMLSETKDPWYAMLRPEK